MKSTSANFINRKTLKNKKFDIMNIVAPLIVLALIYITLEIIVRVAGISRFVLPTPTAIIVDTIRNMHFLWPHLIVTLRNILIGFIIAVPLGILLAAFFSWFKILVQATMPLLILLIVTPMITLIPLFLLWLGFNPIIRVVVVVLQATPIIAINTLVGFINIEEDKIELMKSLGASKMQTFKKVILPNAIPQIFTGIILGGIFSTIGAISADIVAGNIGLGYKIMVYAGMVNTEMVYGLIIIIALIGLTLYKVITFIEGKVIVWKRS